DRPRPPVERLDDVAATASFPSGHTAGAVALYGALAVLAALHLRRAAVRWLVIGVLALVPVAVALSRLYRGMHYPTDVAGGAVVGGAWLATVAGTTLASRTERDR
ncbi:MAG TPA: phosphatase PAP2 family protein, partial [Acidimicrobiales bacterium]